MQYFGLASIGLEVKEASHCMLELRGESSKFLLGVIKS